MNNTDETAHSKEPDQGPEDGTGWADMFRGTRGVYTVLLNLGIGVHAIDIFVITLSPRDLNRLTIHHPVLPFLCKQHLQ